MNQKPQSRRENIVVQEYDGEVLIYDLENDRAFCLNKTAGLVWQACDGNRTVSDISRQLSERFSSAVGEDFVWLALEQLKKSKLLENGAELTAPFAGESRREIIRRIGLASMAALPMIYSLVAPTVASAQSACGAASGRPIGCPCSINGNCANNCCGTTPSGNQCVTIGLEPLGSGCRVNCECASGMCTGSPQTCTA